MAEKLIPFFHGKFVKVIPDEEWLIISQSLETYIRDLEREIQELKRERMHYLFNIYNDSLSLPPFYTESKRLRKKNQ